MPFPSGTHSSREQQASEQDPSHQPLVPLASHMGSWALCPWSQSLSGAVLVPAPSWAPSLSCHQPGHLPICPVTHVQ